MTVASFKPWLLLSTIITGCSSAKFAGTVPERAAQSPKLQVEMSSAVPGAQLPVIGVNNVPSCADGLKLTGVQLAFIVDNSGSNSNTDCPTRSVQGIFGGGDMFASCGGPTAREKAILDTYDMLAKAAGQSSSDALAESRIAIASFPTRADERSGWQNQLNWQPLTELSRPGVTNTIRFTRSPVGYTPYSAALTAATSVFANAAKDSREKVAVLISDGQATDSNPSAVEAQAEALKASGVKVYVVIYGGTLSEMADSHVKQMTRLQDQAKATSSNWYASNYANFDDYLKALVGTKGEGGLAAKVADTGRLIELKSADSLATTIRNLVATQAIKCSAR